MDDEQVVSDEFDPERHLVDDGLTLYTLDRGKNLHTPRLRAGPILGRGAATDRRRLRQNQRPGVALGDAPVHDRPVRNEIARRVFDVDQGELDCRGPVRWHVAGPERATGARRLGHREERAIRQARLYLDRSGTRHQVITDPELNLLYRSCGERRGYDRGVNACTR